MPIETGINCTQTYTNASDFKLKPESRRWKKGHNHSHYYNLRIYSTGWNKQN